jgi:hypothetical protein
MRFSTLITMLLVTGVILFVAGMMIEEADMVYNTDINTSKWEGKYDYATQVNSSINPLIDSFEKIQDEDIGWFTKLTAGISAVPKAVVLIPSLIFQSLRMGGNLITGVLTSLSIPLYIITVAIIMLLVWGVFKLVEFFQRWNI